MAEWSLHDALYGHGFVAMETTWESFRQHCRLHSKWKVCCWCEGESGCACVRVRVREMRCSKWTLFGQSNIKSCSKSPLRIKGQQIRETAPEVIVLFSGYKCANMRTHTETHVLTDSPWF